MPKQQKSSLGKLKSYINEFPNEFLNTPKTELHCAKCNVIVNHDRRSNITKHRESTNTSTIRCY